MIVVAEKVTIHDVLALTRYLSAAERNWLVELRNQQEEMPLPEQTTLDTKIDSSRIETQRIQV